MSGVREGVGGSVLGISHSCLLILHGPGPFSAISLSSLHQGTDRGRSRFTCLCRPARLASDAIPVSAADAVDDGPSQPPPFVPDPSPSPTPSSSSSARSSPSRPMDSSDSPRPPRPTRAAPPAPHVETNLPPSPDPDDAHFATPLASPLVDSPVHEQPSDGPHSDSPSASVPPQEHQNAPLSAPHNATDLTPVRAHYLKKELVHLQFRRELDALVAAPANNVSTFSYLGPPFTPPPKDAPYLDLPFLKFVFRRFVLSFPFLAAAPKDFFPDKVQPFLGSLLSRNLSPTSVLDDNPEDSEEAARHRLLNKLERNLAMLLTSAIKLVEPEEVVRLSQADLNRLEALARKRAARERKLKDSFDINVVCVRTVTEKKRMRSKVHEVCAFRELSFRRKAHLVSGLVGVHYPYSS